jgi:hypothetical protein
MIRGEFSDGDAAAAAFAELQAAEAAKREAERAKQVKITAGVRDDLLEALREARTFVDRFTDAKKPHGERTPARAIVARVDELLRQLEGTKSATAKKRAGRRAQSRASKAPD